MSVITAAASGNRYELLLALRERLSVAIADPTCPARDLAALTRRLMDVAKEIAELEERMRQENLERDSNRNGQWELEDV